MSKFNLELGVYLTPEMHDIYDNSESRVRLFNLLGRVNDKFNDEFDTSFNMRIIKAPYAQSIPELFVLGKLSTSNKSDKKLLDDYVDATRCGKILMDYKQIFSGDLIDRYKLILINRNGNNHFGNICLGSSDEDEKLAVVNIATNEDLRYRSILHELSHLFGANDSSIGYGIMGRIEKASDFWSPFTKIKMKRRIKKVCGGRIK
ncbi:MAG: hypothetical protein WC867_03205 [Candidatus Pacearchaeota archaeon]|jgi:hypothetical protein